MRLTDIIKALYKEPGKALTQKYVPNTLDALQRTVGGYIEVVPLRPDLVMIVNEEGKLRQMEANFRICLGGWVDEIVGPALFAAIQDAPAVDVEKVVRCKDCEYREREQPGMVYCPNTVGGWVDENWFCAGGEKE